MKSDCVPENLIRSAEESLRETFSYIDEVSYSNQKKILDVFRQVRLSPDYFASKTGYGMDDAGRDLVDAAFAGVFGGEQAIVRMQMVSGTHAIACALFGNLLPGDEVCAITGEPYDTMRKVIGLSGNSRGSLLSMGMRYRQENLIPLLYDETALAGAAACVSDAQVVYIQKSCGYSAIRPTLSVDQIGMLVRAVKQVNPECLVFVDNCYGEFVEDSEPLSCGADLIAGSLIKNPGGGLAISGGYIAGRAFAVERASERLTAPGVGGHLGLTFGQNRLVLQGLFMAPSVVASAVKGAHLFARIFAELGFECVPEAGSRRFDIIQVIKFGEPDFLANFCRALQQVSPVDAHVVPTAAEMPGYDDQVIMAGGTFVEGATIELSADGPLRPPYAAFVQGGLSYPHVRVALAGLLELGRSVDYRFY